VSANYVHLGGRGKFHVEVDRCGQTVCGKPVPTEVRTTLYRPALCARCGNDEAAVTAAEMTRKQHWEKVDAQRRDVREAQRKGVFVVYRCRLCGAQHQRPQPGGGVPFCITDNHVADLEEVAAQGPAWVAPTGRHVADERRKEASDA
jgi:endogenous inhibitor of DNA gyrase (YacG/DUF329 family)